MLSTRQIHVQLLVPGTIQYRRHHIVLIHYRVISTKNFQIESHLSTIFFFHRTMYVAYKSCWKACELGGN
jgi:hypothetical protein